MQLSNWPRLALLGVLTVAPLTACAPAVAPALARNAEPAGQSATDGAAAGSATAPTAGFAAVGPPIDGVVAPPGRSLTQTPFYLGIRRGVFADENLNLSMMTMASPVAIAALMDGQV